MIVELCASHKIWAHNQLEVCDWFSSNWFRFHLNVTIHSQSQSNEIQYHQLYSERNRVDRSNFSGGNEWLPTSNTYTITHLTSISIWKRVKLNKLTQAEKEIVQWIKSTIIMSVIVCDVFTIVLKTCNSISHVHCPYSHPSRTWPLHDDYLNKFMWCECACAFLLASMFVYFCLIFFVFSRFSTDWPLNFMVSV